MSKRYKVLAYLKKRGAQFAMLRETHLNESKGKALQQRWRGQMYYITYSAFTMGVLLWVSPGVPFQCTWRMVDPEGRYVAVMG